MQTYAVGVRASPGAGRSAPLQCPPQVRSPADRGDGGRKTARKRGRRVQDPARMGPRACSRWGALSSARKRSGKEIDDVLSEFLSLGRPFFFLQKKRKSLFEKIKQKKKDPLWNLSSLIDQSSSSSSSSFGPSNAHHKRQAHWAGGAFVLRFHRRLGHDVALRPRQPAPHQLRFGR